MNAHEFWTDRLSDFLDGDLPEREAEAVRGHLADCSACRAVKEELDEVRNRARALGETGPGRDLWPEIRARLGEDPLRDEVIDLTLHLEDPPAAHSGDPERARRGIYLPFPQLAAAALVLLFGGWALGGGLVGPLAEAGTDAALDEIPLVVRQASTAVDDASVVDRVAELERILRNRSADLPQETREILERNLAVIDRALAESLEALRAEPDSEYLRDHVERSLERREAALQATVRLIERGD